MKATIPSLITILAVSVVILVASRYWMEPTENFEIYSVDTLSETDLTYLKYILNSILELLNKKIKKDLVLIGIDRVKKISIKKGIEYTVTFYTLNKNNRHDDNNNLIYVKFVISEEEVKVHELRMGYSQEYVMPRVPVSSRGSTLYKPPQGKNVKGAIDLSDLEFTSVPEMTGETVSTLELNSEIPHREEVELRKKNYTPFASKKNQVKWDTYGVNVMDCPNPDIQGSYHGRVAPKIVPNYTPSLFQGRNTNQDYYWLFDLKQDSASRPVGV